MRDDAQYGWALILGTAGAMVTMAIHPTGRDLLVSPEAAGHVAALSAAVHSLAIISIGVTLVGATGLSRRLVTQRLDVTAALIAYWIAVIAATAAATISGFVAPVVGKALVGAEPEARAVLRQLFQFSGMLNQGFAKVYVVASAVAIALWCVALLRTRTLPAALAWAGFAVTAVTLAALVIGHLRLDVHGFGAVVFVEGAWMIAVGVLLMRNRGSASGAVHGADGAHGAGGTSGIARTG